jgi:hypothetical protein
MHFKKYSITGGGVNREYLSRMQFASQKHFKLDTIRNIGVIYDIY